MMQITFLMDNDDVLVDDKQDYLWFKKIPEILAKKRNISFEEAYALCVKDYEKFEGTLEWYDVDFWENKLGINFKRYVKTPELFEDAKQFLEKFGSQTIVVTAAHPSILNITTKNVKNFVRKIYSSFEFGLPKESVSFFHALMKKENLIPENCVFVDDKIANVMAARKAGIKSFLLDRKLKKNKKGVINSLLDLSTIVKQTKHIQ